MATVTIQNGMPQDLDWGEFFRGGDLLTSGNGGTLENRTTTSMAYRVQVDGHDFLVTLTGTGFAYDDDAGPNVEDNPYYDDPVPTGGVITSIVVTFDPDSNEDGPKTALSITGLNVQALDFLYKAFDFQSPFEGGGHGSDPWGTASLLLAGNDIIQVANDVTWNIRNQVGDNTGNDKLYGGSVDDYFEASKGNDYYDGKGGNDTLSYSWPTYDGRNGAAKGIVLDAIGKTVKALGTVTDSWGNTDTFRSIENFQGSKFADKMSGANQPMTGNARYDEWFFGLGGKDTIDGRGGWDWVSYQEDAIFGGMKGIVANLSVVDKNGFASIKDGFGLIDKVKNIESIMGTAFKDTMIGNNKDNGFQGLAGNDIIDGKGGSDWIMYWKNGQYINNGWTGGDGKVVVDLSVKDGQGYSSVTDGLGGTDLVRNVENVVGSQFNDTLTGDANANKLIGIEGDDILDGKEGHDELEGGDGADEFHFSVAVIAANSDEVNDFNSGDGDRIVLHKSVFSLAATNGANDLAGEFLAVAGGMATASGQRIIYDTNNGNLYYDADGDGAGARVLIAHFGGNPAIVSTDFDIVN